MDEDGQPILTPEEIKNVINSIPSFRFDEKSRLSSVKSVSRKLKSGKEDDSKVCSVCLD